MVGELLFTYTCLLVDIPIGFSDDRSGYGSDCNIPELAGCDGESGGEHTYRVGLGILNYGYMNNRL